MAGYTEEDQLSNVSDRKARVRAALCQGEADRMWPRHQHLSGGRRRRRRRRRSAQITEGRRLASTGESAERGDDTRLVNEESDEST